jgi:RNA polymerase sigma-B factor
MSFSPERASGLSRDERSAVTRDLLAQARATDVPERRSSLLADVVVVNRRIADAVAMRYRDRGVDLEDLQQAAYEGLVKAVRSYDESRAEDLLTYAVPTIRGEVQRYFRDRSWVVRPPRRLQELQARMKRQTELLGRELGRQPSPDEVRVAAGLSERELTDLAGMEGCFSPTSLDQAVGPEGGTTLAEMVAAADTGWDAAEARCVLAEAVRGLTERDRRLLDGLYFRQCTQHELGQELGMTQVQVSRALRTVLATLRARVGGVPEDVLVHAG